MKKGTKILALTLFSLILISFMIGVVSAGPLDTWLKSGGSIFKDLGEGAKDMLSQVLLIALVVMLVYSIVSFLPFVPKDKDYVNWIIATIIGILSFIYVPMEDIKVLVANYEALGIALTTLIPLVIIMVFTAKLREHDASIAAIVNPPIKILFAIYTVYRWFTASPTSDLKWIYVLTAILAILWFFFEKWAVIKLFKQVLKGEVDVVEKDSLIKATAEIERLNRLLETADGKETIASLQNQIKKQRAKIKELSKAMNDSVEMID